MSYYISPLSDLLGMTVSRCIHIAANGIISFFLMAEHYSIPCMYHFFSIYSSVNGHLGCFHILAIINVIQWTLGCMYPFSSHFPLDICLGVRFQGHMVALFLVFLRNLHTVFHSEWTNLHFHQWCRRIPFPKRVFMHFPDSMRLHLVPFQAWSIILTASQSCLRPLVPRFVCPAPQSLFCLLIPHSSVSHHLSVWVASSFLLPFPLST